VGLRDNSEVRGRQCERVEKGVTETKTSRGWPGASAMIVEPCRRLCQQRKNEFVKWTARGERQQGPLNGKFRRGKRQVEGERKGERKAAHNGKGKKGAGSGRRINYEKVEINFRQKQ